MNLPFSDPCRSMVLCSLPKPFVAETLNWRCWKNQSKSGIFYPFAKIGHLVEYCLEEEKKHLLRGKKIRAFSLRSERFLRLDQVYDQFPWLLGSSQVFEK